MNNIAKPLMNEVADFVRFVIVCKYWKNTADKLKNKTMFMPWLILPQLENEDSRKCYSLSKGDVFHLYLPECRDKRCFGSPFGWVLTVGLDHSVQLLNPLTRRQLSLPSLPPSQYPYGKPDHPMDLFRMLVSQFVMSSASSGCVVMVIYHEHYKIAYASPGDEAWKEVDTYGFTYDDAIFFNGRFFLLNRLGMLSICEIDTPRPKPVYFMPKSPRNVHTGLAEKYNLVEMCGDLHLIVRLFGGDAIRYVAKVFKVFRLDFDSKKWIELADLGEHALFVGTNSPFSVSTSDYKNLKPNSIYFTDDDVEGYTVGEGGGRGMGVFDFEKKTIEHFYMGDGTISSLCPPLLFMPSLE